MDRAAIKAAVQERHSYIANNLESLSLKKCRQLIAKDMGLPENGLDGEKKYVLELIDEIVTRVANNAAGPTPTKQKAAPAVKRKKTDHSDDGKDRQRTGAVKGGSNQAATPYGATVDKLKGVCKAASITVAPSVYTRVSSAQDVEDRLRALLAKHGLSDKSPAADVARVRKRLAKERDLEGIETSNIVAAGRRSRTEGAKLQSRFQPSRGVDEADSEEEHHLGNENARPSNACSKGRSEAKGTQEAPGEAMEDASSSDDAKHGRIYGEEDMAAQQQATETRGEQEQDAGNAEQAAGGERAKQRIAAWSDDDE